MRNVYRSLLKRARFFPRRGIYSYAGHWRKQRYLLGGRQGAAETSALPERRPPDDTFKSNLRGKRTHSGEQTKEHGDWSRVRLGRCAGDDALYRELPVWRSAYGSNYVCGRAVVADLRFRRCAMVAGEPRHQYRSDGSAASGMNLAGLEKLI